MKVSPKNDFQKIRNVQSKQKNDQILQTMNISLNSRTFLWINDRERKWLCEATARRFGDATAHPGLRSCCRICSRPWRGRSRADGGRGEDESGMEWTCVIGFGPTLDICRDRGGVSAGWSAWRTRPVFPIPTPGMDSIWGLPLSPAIYEWYEEPI